MFGVTFLEKCWFRRYNIAITIGNSRCDVLRAGIMHSSLLTHLVFVYGGCTKPSGRPFHFKIIIQIATISQSSFHQETSSILHQDKLPTSLRFSQLPTFLNKIR